MPSHSYWDTHLVRQLGRDAHKVAGNISDADRHAWQTGSSRDWAMESFGVARRFVYAGLPAPQEQVYGLSPRYESAALEMTATQLKKAGVRLAALLNEALAD